MQKQNHRAQNSHRKEIEARGDLPCGTWGISAWLWKQANIPMCPIEYVLESISTIYNIHHKNGAIPPRECEHRCHNGGELSEVEGAGIGTYILFRTYNKRIMKHHPTGPKSNYAYHTEAMDRAQQGGIDDVSCGVLFGLTSYRYDFVGLLMHAEHLEARFGVGPHHQCTAHPSCR